MVEETGAGVSLPPLETILLEAGEVVRAVIAKLPPEERVKRTGGYFALMAEVKPTPSAMGPFKIGSVSAEKDAKYRELSVEKSTRMRNHREHVSSWQSRDGVEKFGGAIRANGFILSFSGLPELADECAMLVLAVRLRLLTFAEATEIAKISSNNLFLETTWGYHP